MLKENINSFVMALSNKESAILKMFLHNDLSITHPNKGGVKNEGKSEKDSR